MSSILKSISNRHTQLHCLKAIVALFRRNLRFSTQFVMLLNLSGFQQIQPHGITRGKADKKPWSVILKVWLVILNWSYKVATEN